MTFLLPSRRGICILALCFAIYMASTVSNSGLLFMILGIMFVTFIFNIFGAWRSVHAIRIEPPPSIRVMEGTPATDPWKVVNPSRHTIGHIAVRSKHGSVLKIPGLAPGESRFHTPQVTMRNRGVYSLGSIRLYSAYPYGLIMSSRRLDLAGEIVVYPNVYPCITPRAAGFEPMVGGRYRGKFLTSTGESFHGVRPKQPQDAMKMIHWPSSSKGQGLMVKEFEEELAGRVSLIVSGPDTIAEDGSRVLDWAARAAASLAMAGLGAGHHIHLLSSNSDRPVSVPPFGDGELILETLARMTPEPAATDTVELLQRLRHLPRKSSVYLILTEIPNDIERIYAATAGRQLTLLLPEQMRARIGSIQWPVIIYGSDRVGEAPVR